MGRKRKHRDCSDGENRREIKKLEKKLKKRRRRSRSSSSETTSESQHHDHRHSDTEPEIILSDEEDCYNEVHEPDIRSVVLTPTSYCTEPIPSTSKEGVSLNVNKEDKTSEVIPLDDDILTLLGDAPREDTPVGSDIHADIANRLMDVLQSGLKKETKDKFKEDYPTPGNCPLFKAPILNPEIKAAVSDLPQKKDSSIASRQDQVGLALTVLTKVLDILVVDKSEKSQSILKHVSNACRLLCDSHYIDTKMRRNFLISTLNNKVKDTLKETKWDKCLFGESLAEKLRATKAISKTSLDLKTSQPKPSKGYPATGTSSRNLNWRPPQSNYQSQNRKNTTQRTAGGYSRNVTQRNDSLRRQPTQSSSRARTNAHYKNQRRT